MDCRGQVEELLAEKYGKGLSSRIRRFQSAAGQQPAAPDWLYSGPRYGFSFGRLCSCRLIRCLCSPAGEPCLLAGQPAIEDDKAITAKNNEAERMPIVGNYDHFTNTEVRLYWHPADGFQINEQVVNGPLPGGMVKVDPCVKTEKGRKIKSFPPFVKEAVAVGLA